MDLQRYLVDKISTVYLDFGLRDTFESIFIDHMKYEIIGIDISQI